MARNIYYPALLLLILTLIYTPSNVMAVVKPAGKNNFFPNRSFNDKLPPEQASYLGTDEKKSFSFRDISGTVFVIEMFSTYCMSCPGNYPVINSVYSATQKTAQFKEKVKVIGIAVGNTQAEIINYTDKHVILFPVLTDYSFALHKALGSPRVPFTLILRRISGNRHKIVYAHQGIIESEDVLLKNIKAATSK